MITIGICILVGIVIGVKESLRWNFDFMEWFLNIFSGCVGGVGVGIVIAFILPMDLEGKKEILMLESLQDGSKLSGQFFLGSGHIDGKMQYVFYYENDGYYKMMQAESELVKVKYFEGRPQVEITTQWPTDSWINYFGLSSDVGDKTYIIQVPKGTIHNNYNLDAQ